ncbi:hypothetical protein ATO12_19250 [Aquimarina atlantica]|uniref:CHAT domain-containing protein n=1 Tax=Aquimarina atlantica TaxID=1317122 RepID=A0A023BT44_9FLAO|nr:CHAT domain-containing protein [Aquimarina atlantica]EZH73145.1 hypothetical protein ATO12_19250 [Aquimarina atlantica]
MRKYVVILFFCISYFLTFSSRGQEISFSLDSISKLPGSNYEKLGSYYTLLDGYKKSNNLTQLGFDAHQLAKWIHKEKKWDKAIEIAKIAYLARENAIPFNPELLKRSYYNYANFNRKKENYTIAIRYFRKMIEVKGSDFFNGKAYALIGECYGKIGDLYQAVEHQLQAFVDFESKKQKAYTISNHINIAVSYRNIRNRKSNQKAVSHLLTADSLIHTLEKPNLHDLYAIYNNLGLYYKEAAKDHDMAIEYFKKALEIAKKMGIDRNLGQIHYNLGISNIDSDNVIAEEHLNQSLVYSKNVGYLIPKIYMGLGISAFTKEDYNIAQEQYRKAFSYYFNIDIPDTDWLPKKEHLIHINNKATLLELFKKKIQAYLEHGKKEKDSSSHLSAIKTVMASDLLIDIIMKENLSYKSKLFWRSLISEIYILGLEACINSNNKDAAFYFMEKNKALLLTQDITKKKISIPEEVLEQEKKLENEIIKFQNQFKNSSKKQKDSLSAIILSKKSELSHYKDSLSYNYPEYFSSYTIPEMVSLSDIKLKDNQIIINYTMAEEVLGALPNAYGMVLSNTQKKVFKIENINQLTDNIYDLRKKLKKPFKTWDDIQRYKEVSHLLYNTLIPLDIRKELKNKKVTIIADHNISLIPFEALVTNIELGTYLIEESEINYAYSLSFLKENKSIARTSTQDFLGIAPVNFSNHLTTLHSSNEEIKTANIFYDGSLFTKENATKKNFIKEANKYKILHLATHADASDSIAPWIAFYDNKLIANELTTIKNNAELVILSACNTSLGKLNRGEGLMSLAREFFKSGANTVIPSLWNTNDKSTATITSDFYKSLSEGKTKSQALRIAKLNYLKSNSDADASPYYWAPLVLIGDTGTLVPKSNYNFLIYSIIIITTIILLLLFFRYRRHK